MSFIGLDIGTMGCKALVVDEAGGILGAASHEYPVDVPRPGWAEQDAEAVWRLAWESVVEAVDAAGSATPLALALSVQGEAVMPVDAEGVALRPAILGMDIRTTAENRWLADRFGGDALYRRTGMPLHTINTLPKLLWLQHHEPQVWREAQRFFLYEDYLLNKLGGAPAISHCLASRTQMYDPQAGDWDRDLLAACDIDPGRLAPLAPAKGGVVGAMRPELARRLGAERVQLVSGGHDQACAALGSGVTRPGQAMVSTGTAEVLELALAEPLLNERLSAGGISVYRHVVPGLYLAMTLNHSGGLLLRWFRDTLCAAERDAARIAGQDAYDALLADLPDGPTRLLVLPHLAGSGTPHLDVASKAAILGLTTATTRADIAKALLEGLTFELRLNVELLREAGVELRALHAVGGGARSRDWLQLKADICRVPLRLPRVSEAASLGAAMLAAIGAGIHADAHVAVAAMVRYGSPRVNTEHTEDIEPREGMARAYDERYALYRMLYPTLREINARL